jgi:hypothetical protein
MLAVFASLAVAGETANPTRANSSPVPDTMLAAAIKSRHPSWRYGVNQFSSGSAMRRPARGRPGKNVPSLRGWRGLLPKGRLLHRECDSLGVCFEADGSLGPSQGAADRFDAFAPCKGAENFHVGAGPGAMFGHGGSRDIWSADSNLSALNSKLRTRASENAGAQLSRGTSARS